MRAFAAVLILASVTVAGCATTPAVRVDRDPATDLTEYKTFAFFEASADGGGCSGFYRYRFGAYGPWGGYPQDLETVQYKAGTLSVDLVDMRTRSLVWQGLAEGRISRDAYEQPAPTIDRVVAEIFRKFPPAPVVVGKSLQQTIDSYFPSTLEEVAG